MDNDWKFSALCAGMDPQLFELPDIVTEASKRVALNSAMTVCPECPVIDMCLKTASAEDRAYTVRGGKAPASAFRGRPPVDGVHGKYVTSDPERVAKAKENWFELRPDGLCKNGHDTREPGMLGVRSSGPRYYGFCYMCRYGKVPARKGVVATETHCINGHPWEEGNEGYKMKGGRSVRECLTCRSEQKSRSRGKMPA